MLQILLVLLLLLALQPTLFGNGFGLGKTLPSIGQWITLGGAIIRIGFSIGRSLVSIYSLYDAKSAIKHNKKLLDELKSSTKKLEERICSTAKVLNITKEEAIMKLLVDGGTILKAAPYYSAKLLPNYNTRKLTTAGMALGDCFSFWNDWVTIRKLINEDSKGQVSQCSEGFIYFLEWQRDEIRIRVGP